MATVSRSKLFAAKPILPDVLKVIDETDDTDEQLRELEYRLEPALGVLVSRSLTIRIGHDREQLDGGTDRYQMVRTPRVI